MDADTFEKLLRGLPTRSLDVAREAELIAALSAAGAPPRERWWRTPIRLWQAAAACAAVALLSIATTVAWRVPDNRPVNRVDHPLLSTQRTHVRSAFFACTTPRATSVNLAQWHVLSAHPSGD